MNLPKIPAKHSALVEIEKRRRSIREQRFSIEAELQKVQAALARLATRDDDEMDVIAERLAAGEITEVSPTASLSARRDELQSQLDLVRRADAKATKHLAAQRAIFDKAIVAAFQPTHTEAVREINQALEALVKANQAEEAVRLACPVALVNLSFPSIGDFTCNGGRTARAWREYVGRLGYLADDEPASKPSPPGASARRGQWFSGNRAAGAGG